MDCLQVGEFILNQVMEKDGDNKNDRVDVVKAAYHVKCGKVIIQFNTILFICNERSESGHIQFL